MKKLKTADTYYQCLNPVSQILSYSKHTAMTEFDNLLYAIHEGMRGDLERIDMEPSDE